MPSVHYDTWECRYCRTWEPVKTIMYDYAKFCSGCSRRMILTKRVDDPPPFPGRKS